MISTLILKNFVSNSFKFFSEAEREIPDPDQKKLSWVVRTAFHVPRGSLWKKLLSTVFETLRETFQDLLKKYLDRIVKNAIYACRGTLLESFFRYTFKAI